MGLLTLKDTAAQLGWSDGYLRRLRREGLFPRPIVIGKSKRYSQAQIDEYIRMAHIRVGFIQ